MRVIVCGGEWRPIPGLEGRYEVSDQGEVRSLLAHRGQPGPRLLTPATDNRGYLQVRLTWPGSRQRTLRVHQIVALAFIGERPEGLETRHLDGDKLNNQLSNLAYGTPSENRADSIAHGTHRNQWMGVTHCARGHELTPENTYVWRGWRKCRRCGRDRERTYRLKRRKQEVSLCV